MPLLDVKDLRTYFHTRAGIVRAVDGVSFSVEKGEMLGIVGESGSGKSVANLSLLGLVPSPPGRIESGVARFGDLDLLSCTKAERRAVRGKRISMIFQDPMTALNPFHRIGDQIMEPLRIHDGVSRKVAFARAVDMLQRVGIQDAERRMRAFPHQFSGGMRQRVMIAIALITNPELLIADEPTTALDVTVQAQILELMKRMQGELRMAVILVTHDLGVIAESCDRVHVMYAGRIVESAATTALFAAPKHPYTRALLASIPATQKKGTQLHTIAGSPPDLTQSFTGCPFAPRCEYAAPECVSPAISLNEVAPAHWSACVRVQSGVIT
ncbi:MAG TPA: ABC transporter ATP-binding protein [Candidatus Hydrogenedentes bacterium]|nr:ABC transporter ATP-binding protein [Candidatus Hydrogenedentota bacterium]